MKVRRKIKFLKKILNLMVFALLLGAMGCSAFKSAVKPNPEEFTNVVFDTAFDETWEAIQTVARSESLPIHLIDKALGIIETQKILEFNKKKLYRQYISIYTEVRPLSQNFTSVSISYFITRYDPVTHIWKPIRGSSREKNFLNKVKAVLEAG